MDGGGTECDVGRGWYIEGCGRLNSFWVLKLAWRTDGFAGSEGAITGDSSLQFDSRPSSTRPISASERMLRPTGPVDEGSSAAAARLGEAELLDSSVVL